MTTDSILSQEELEQMPGYAPGERVVRLSEEQWLRIEASHDALRARIAELEEEVERSGELMGTYMQRAYDAEAEVRRARDALAALDDDSTDRGEGS